MNVLMMIVHSKNPVVAPLFTTNYPIITRITKQGGRRYRFGIALEPIELKKKIRWYYRN